MVAEPPFIPGDPEHGRACRNAGLVVGLLPLLLRVVDFNVVPAHFAAKGCVVAVEIGVEPFPHCLQSAGFLVLVDECFGLCLFGLEVLFLGVQGAREEGGHWCQSFVERHVGDHGEDGENDHNHQGTDDSADGEEANHAYLSQVDPGDEVLQCPWIDKAFGVDFHVVHEQEVVPVCLVHQVEANKRKAQDKWCNAGVCQGYPVYVRASFFQGK